MKTFVKARTKTITFEKKTGKFAKNKPESKINKYRGIKAIRKLLGLYREK